MNTKIVLARIVPFICSVLTTETEQPAMCPVEQTNSFYKGLHTVMSQVEDESKLSNHRSSLLNALFKTKNCSYISSTGRDGETSMSLTRLILVIRNSKQFKKCADLFPQNISGQFLESLSLDLLEKLSMMNETGEGVIFPLRSFSDLFVDFVHSISAEDSQSLTDDISKALSMIEVSIDSIYSTLMESVEVDKAIIKALNAKVGILHTACERVNSLGEEALKGAVSTASSSALLNTRNLKTYFSTIGSAVESLVKLYTSEPSAVLFATASTSIFDLFKCVLFFTIKKEKLQDFLTAYDGKGFGFFKNYLTAITSNPTMKSSDSMPTIKSSKIGEFIEQAKAEFEALERERTVAEAVQEIFALIANPISELIETPIAMPEVTEAPVVVSEVIKAPVVVSENAVVPTVPADDGAKPKKSTNKLWTIAAPVAALISLIALGLIFYSKFAKKQEE